MTKPKPNNERRKLVHLRLEYDDGCFRHVSIEPEGVKFQLFYPDMKPVLEEQTMTRESFIRDIGTDVMPAGAMRKYTVILMFPDWMAEDAHESWCGSVEAVDPVQAVTLAQQQAAKDNHSNESMAEDFLPVSVFEGEHADLINQWAEAQRKD